MADRLFDVHLELDPLRLAREKDPTRTIAELSYHAAVEHADANGLRLTDPEPREVHVRQGLGAQTGRDVMLVATRWRAC